MKNNTPIIMKNYTQIILVGHTEKRLIEGIRQFPTNKLILVVGEDPNLEGEAKVIEIAATLEDIFKEFMSIERLYIDKENVLKATRKILNKILEETKIGYEIRINVSGSLRQMAIACYIAALVSQTPLYSVIPKYDQNYQEVGVKEIYNIPFFSIKELAKENIKILEILEESNSIDSIDQLITKLDPNVTEADYNKTRAKVSYYLKDLEIEGFIHKRRTGKKVTIEITDIGNIYIVGQHIIDFKKDLTYKKT